MIVALLGAGPEASAARATAALRAALERVPVLADPRLGAWEDRAGGTCLAWAAPPPERLGGARLVACEEHAAAVVLGRPVRWRGEAADGRTPLDARWVLEEPDAAADLDGRWAALGVRAGAPAVATADALGAYPLYQRHLRGTTWVSGLPEALRALEPGTLTPDPDVLASLVGVGWSLAGHPWWEEIRRLPDAGVHHLDGRSGTVRSTPARCTTAHAVAHLHRGRYDGERAARRLVALTGALADWPGRPAVVPVTGGRDSRVVLAAARAAGVAQDTLTGGSPGQGDVEVGRRLAEAVGARHRLLGPDPHGDRDRTPGRAAGVLAALGAGTASLADAAGFPLGPRDAPLEIWLTGQGGEIARRSYGRGLPTWPLAEAQVLRTLTRWRPDRRGVLGRDGLRRVRRLVHDLAVEAREAGARPADLPDLAYLRRRMRTWAGPSHGAVEPIRDSASPLWSVRLLEDLLAPAGAQRAAQAVHRDLVARLAPDLAAIPLADGTPWDAHRGPLAARGRRVGAAVGRRLPRGRQGVRGTPPVVAEAAAGARTTPEAPGTPEDRQPAGASGTPGAAEPTAALDAPAAAAAAPEGPATPGETFRRWCLERPAHPVWRVADRERALALLDRPWGSLADNERDAAHWAATALGGLSEHPG